MAFFRKVEDNLVLTLDHGRLVLAAIGAFLFVALVFLMGVQVGKAMSARSMEEALRTLSREPAHTPPPVESRPANPQLSFYEEVKKPADSVGEPGEMKPIVAAEEKYVPTQVTPTSPYVPPPPAPPQTEAAPAPVAAPAPAKPAVPAGPAKTLVPVAKAEIKARLLAPTPPATPPAVKSGGFAVQIESYQEKGKAEAAQKKLSAKGIITEVAPSQVGGAMWYRLIVSGFPSREAAEKYKKETLKQKGFNGYVITR